jgi:hypothetical protein
MFFFFVFSIGCQGHCFNHVAAQLILLVVLFNCIYNSLEFYQFLQDSNSVISDSIVTSSEFSMCGSL